MKNKIAILFYAKSAKALKNGLLPIYLRITIDSETIEFHDKKFSKGQIIGGLIFGLGWAITGACPGPIFAQIGTGVTVMIVTLFFAIVGTWVYGYFRDKLPH